MNPGLGPEEGRPGCDRVQRVARTEEQSWLRPGERNESEQLANLLCQAVTDGEDRLAPEK